MPQVSSRSNSTKSAPSTVKRSLTSIKGRLTTLEKRLDAQAAQLEQFQMFTSEVGKLAMKALLEEKRRSAADHLPGLTRTLLTARATTFKAIEQAVSRYRKACRYLRQAQQHRQQARGKVRSVFEDYCARFRNWCEEEQKVLRDLNVSLVEITPGDPFDQEIMDSFEQLPTGDPAQANTVAEVYEHAFRFRDEHGNQQLIPGQVDVFGDLLQQDPAPVPVLPRCSDDQLHAIALEAITTSYHGNGHD